MHLMGGGNNGNNPCNYDGSHVSNHMVGSVGIQNKYEISSSFDDFSNKEHQAGVRIVYEDVDCSGNAATKQGSTSNVAKSHSHGGNCEPFIYDPEPRLMLFENNVLDKARHEKMGTMTYSTAHSVVVMGRPIPPPLKHNGDVESEHLHGIDKQRYEEGAREALLFESDAKKLKEYTEYLKQHVITGKDGASTKESNIYPINSGNGKHNPDHSNSIADRGGSFSLDNYQGLTSFYKEDGILTRERERETALDLHDGCREVYTQWVGARGGSACIAVAKVAPQYLTSSTSKDKDVLHSKAKAPGIHRFDWNIDENNADRNYVPDPHHPKPQEFQGNEYNKGQYRPCGFFRKVPKIRGFQRVREKLGPFVSNYAGADGIGKQLDRKLKLHNIKAGDDVTMMVVNEGEIDLFMNFACSCQQHGIDITNVFVFAASPEIVKLIESVGAMALFHPGYASVSKKASNDYLDRVFVDMMWYKSFSVHLLCLRGINVLFQDVDLVWFRNPFPYFHKYIETSKPRSILSGTSPSAFFSDDGQRSLRYSPFFANSGFYYLVGGYRSAHLAWSIMTAFDAVQVLGSHQNVFTLKMVEGLSVNAASSVLLSLKDFPNGIMYHHDKGYMKKLHARGYISDPTVSSESDKEEQYKYQLSVSMSSPHYPSPYHFHMCWTQGKPDKLKYLRLAQMWYLTDQCSPLEAYASANTPQGDPNNNINSQNIKVERGSLIKYMQQTYNEVGATYADKQHLSLLEDENGGVYLMDKSKGGNGQLRGGKKKLDTSSADGVAYRSLQQGVAGHMVKHCCMSVPNAP
jgi:hypothetical protein